MEGEYVVMKTRAPTGFKSEAVISRAGAEVGTLKGIGGGEFKLDATGDGSFTLSPRVNGEIRPFSMEVNPATSTTPVVTVMNHVFLHGGRFYMFMGIPEDVKPRDHVLGGRYIIRLDRFPFASLEEVDHETWGRLRRLRGVSVAEISGLGAEGHTVRVSEELLGIGIFIAAVSYVLFSEG